MAGFLIDCNNSKLPDGQQKTTDIHNNWSIETVNMKNASYGSLN